MNFVTTSSRTAPCVVSSWTTTSSESLLYKEIQKFTQTIEDADHLSFVQGGGHGGSHPHLVHEMLSALDAGREPWPNATQSANWTCVGICANESAARGGEKVRLPEFTLE